MYSTVLVNGFYRNCDFYLWDFKILVDFQFISNNWVLIHVYDFVADMIDDWFVFLRGCDFY